MARGRDVIRRASFRGIIIFLAATTSLCACSSAGTDQTPAPSAGAFASDASEDAALQRAAAAALGEREGTIIVLDPQSGRVRAVVNPRLAFEQAYPPGSAIKPFTMLMALRAGLIDGESQTLCRGRFARADFEIVCSHPRSAQPFSPAQALAYSCNYYFATLGERLSEGAWSAALASFGFGERTGINADSEAAGTLRRGEWHVRNALGEGDQLLVTPVQLATAYATLVNGGRRLRPQLAAAADFMPQERARILIAPAHRKMLIDGMRGAVRYGTAARAGLFQLPLYVFGKTGTSTASNNFRTQGWFIGFAAGQNAGDNPPPASINLAVLVFLKRAHGSEGAEIARPIFEEYARTARAGHGGAAHPGRGDEETRRGGDEEQSAASDRAASPTVRVRLVSEGRTISLPLEDYLAGALRAEASVEDELEALRAQAVVSRTFALKNLGRHADEGFDFCSTTHCQRFALAADERARQRADQFARRAVAETAGETLRDEAGALIDAYFHAACGGMTADINALWGVPAPAYLRGVRDDYCATMPHRAWAQRIPARELARALRGDERSDVGARLDAIVIAQRDATGRAALITLEGERRRSLRGWDFKLIVGRALGWQMIKSSRFDVARSASDFIFRGSGFGHGLGLCQEGAHVMARRGMSYRQILEHYFPHTNLDDNRRDTGQKTADASPAPSILP
jgi:stage II sporulation protein D